MDSNMLNTNTKTFFRDNGELAAFIKLFQVHLFAYIIRSYIYIWSFLIVTIVFLHTGITINNYYVIYTVHYLHTFMFKLIYIAASSFFSPLKWQKQFSHNISFKLCHVTQETPLPLLR